MDIDFLDLLYSAWNRMVKLLFQPFNFMNWLTLSFVTWLAYLMDQGAGFPNFGNRFNPGNVNSLQKIINDIPKNITPAYVYGKIQELLGPNTAAYLAIGALFVLFGIILGFVIVWIKSRGEFMLIDNIAYSKYEVKAPWHKFVHYGNSLFWWRVGVWFVSLLSYIALLIIGLILALPIAKSVLNKTTPDSNFVVGISIVVFMIICLTIALALINFFLKHIVIPIMYQQQLYILDAWKRFFSLLFSNFGSFFLFVIIAIIVNIASGLAIIVFILATCCTAIIVLYIPFVSTFVFLPVLIYHRLIGLEFLARLDENYNVFAHEYSEFEPPYMEE